MAIETSGFDEFVNDLNNLGNIGNKIGKKAVEEGAQIVLKQQKQDAPRDKNDNEHGADKLEIDDIKKYANSESVIARIGITKENWQFTKSLYFQHYGFEHWKSKEMITPHVGWMNDSFKKCKDKATKTMVEVVNKEIDKILK